MLLAAASGANAAAYQYYWFGNAGDGNWMNVENWSTTSNEYTRATRWPNSSSFDVFIDTSRASDHHVTISIPKIAPSGNTAGCASFTFYDSTGEGTLSLVGEATAEGRTAFPLANNTIPIWSETGHPIRLELFNFDLRSGTLCKTENECAGCSVLVSNCVGTATSNSYYMHLPGQHGGTMTIIDSRITTQNINGTSVSDVAGYVLAVTNSTITVAGSSYIGGSGTVVDVFNSTLAFGMYHPIFGGANMATAVNHPGMSIHFKDSTIRVGRGDSSKFLKFYSEGGEVVFDNVTQEGDLRDINLYGMTTRLKDTAFNFCAPSSNGGDGISGDIYLDNSSWVCTNASHYSISKGPLHVIFSGRAPRFGSTRIHSSYPVTFDFIVPVGGFAHPPINRMDNLATGQVFPSSAVGGSINVLPSSPAARVSGVGIYPLVYMKDVKNNAPVCDLTNLPLTTLPNNKSKFFVTSDYSWEYADVNGKAESDWMEVVPGYHSKVAGVAVKIIGMPPGTVVFMR